MPHAATAGLRLSLDTDPPPEFRGGLGLSINAFHAETVPLQSRRFALRLHDETECPSGEAGEPPDAAGRLVGGLSGVMSWGWLFIDAVWVSPDARGQGAGRMLMARAESHALAEGCHSVWLDTFQAQGFYVSLGYSVFGALEDYPAGQTRYFLRKRLG